MVATTILDELRATGALKTGHFLLSSGRHSDQYVEKFDLLRRPRATEAVCQEIAARFADAGIDVVVGPTTGGIILAYEVARQLGVAAAYAERRGDGSATREFKRGTTFDPNARVLLVDDILTTGGSVRETLATLAVESVAVVGVAVLIDRSREPLAFSVPLTALARLDIATWEPADCPLCAAGDPITKPGTTPNPVREQPVR